MSDLKILILTPLDDISRGTETIKSLLSSPDTILFSIPFLLQGDDSPEYVKQATNSSKNEKHGDGGRALNKEKERIGELEKALQSNIDNKQKQQIKNKI